MSAGGGGGEDLGGGGGGHEALVLGPGAGRPRREAELQPEVGGVARLLVRVLASLGARVQHEALVQQTRGRPERDFALVPGKIFLEAVNIFHRNMEPFNRDQFLQVVNPGLQLGNSPGLDLQILYVLQT